SLVSLDANFLPFARPGPGSPNPCSIRFAAGVLSIPVLPRAAQADRLAPLPRGQSLDTWLTGTMGSGKNAGCSGPTFCLRGTALLWLTPGPDPARRARPNTGTRRPSNAQLVGFFRRRCSDLRRPRLVPGLVHY